MDSFATQAVEPNHPAGPLAPSPPLPLPRWLAAVQVFAVCGIPTQTVVFVGMFLAGRAMGADGSSLTADPSNISFEFFAMSSLFDTALIAVLILVFLTLSGETSRQVFLGRRRLATEAALGLALLPVLYLMVAGVVTLLRTWLPALHNVETNPMAAFMDTPLKAGIFIVVSVLAGGVREELQRAFILHRFEQRLGGIWVGLAVFSLAFGAFHVTQGFDLAIGVGLLGLVWGVLYVKRRSIVASAVSHAAFNAAQTLVQFLSTQ